MNLAPQIRSLLLFVGLSLVATQCFADIPKPPDPPPKRTADNSAGNWTMLKTPSIIAAVAASIGVASALFLRRNRLTKHRGALLLCLGMSLVAAPSYADIAPLRPPLPPTKPAKPSDLPGGATAHFYEVTTDAAKDFSVLRIPRHEFYAIVAESTRKQASSAPLNSQSIVAALAASIGLASVVFLRMNRQTKIAMLFIVGLVGTGAAADAWWNAPPPPLRGEDFPAPSAVREFNHQGRLVVEVVEKGTIELSIGTKAPPQPVKP